MQYRQYIETRVGQMEELLENIKAGRLGWCEDCDCWVPTEELRPNPWGTDCDWPMCIECLADQGLDDNIEQDAGAH